MISRHALGVVSAVLVLALGAAPAAAAGGITAAPSPHDFGNVHVGDPASQTIVLTADLAGVVLDHVNKVGAGCGAFADTYATPLPHTFASVGDTFEMGVTFTPTARGAVSCVFTFVDDNGITQGVATASGTGTAPVMTSSPTSAAFGAVRVVGGTAVQTVTVTNTSTDVGEDLSVTLALSGANAGDFAVDPMADVIAPGASATFDVTFNPSATGNRAATLTISGDDPANPSDAVSLSGTGTTAVIGMTPDPVDFGLVVAGTTATANVTVSNSGVGATLTISDADVTGGSWFALGPAPVAGCAGATSCAYSPVQSIAAGGSKTFSVRCVPPAGEVGTQTGLLTLTSTSDPGGVSEVGLTCTSQAPEIDVSETALAFGDVRLGTTSDLTVIIDNTGTAELTYGLAITTEVPGGQYSVVGCTSNCKVQPGVPVTRTVRFAPTGAAGAKTAMLRVTSDDADEATIDVALSGTGVEPRITKVVPAGATLALGDVVVGAARTGTVTIRNSGTQTLTITSATVTGAGLSITAGEVGLDQVPPAEERSWTVQCGPVARGAISGTFTVASDAANDTSLDVGVTCRGTGGELTVAPSSIDFGAVDLGASQTLPLTLTNIGEVTATILGAAVTDNTLGYTLANVPASIAAGQSATIDVTFAPLSNDDGGPTTIDLDTDWNDLAVPLDGDATTNGIDVSVATLDFGDVRWDQSATGAFTITNTGEGDAGAVTLDLADATFTVDGVTIGGSPVGPVSFALASGEVATVTVTATPSDLALGLQTATLHIDSDLTPAAGVVTSANVALRVVGTAPELTYTPGATVAFGAVDVDGDPATITLELANTGDGPLRVTSLTLDDGGGVFAIDNLGAAPFVLQPGASFLRTVTYDPSIARAAVPGDVGVLELGVEGLFAAGGGAGPALVQVTLTGHGTDRQLAIPADVITFPPTYRNPSDAAPVETVLVSNLGEAPLTLAAVMLTGEAAFELLDAEPVVVEGFGQATFRVRFAPTTVADDLEAQLLISHDDNGAGDGGQALVTLRGDGISREVAVAPGTIDLGVVAVGLPVRLRERIAAGLALTSTGTRAFTIQPLAIDDAAGAFRLLDGADPRTLEPGATTAYDLEFAPQAPGPYEATVRVLLDDDPATFAEVRVTGFAVATSAHGGCAAGGGASGGGLVLLGVVAVLGRRRRRRRPAALAVGVVALGSASAQADDGRQIDATTFRPQVAVDPTMFEVQPATTGPAHGWALDATLGFAARPLQLDVDCGGTCPPSITDGMSDRPVTAQAMLQLAGAYAVTRSVEVGVSVPLWLQAGDQPMFSAAPASGMTLGDVGLHARARVWQRQALALGAAARVTAPTASGDEFIGGAGPTADLRGLVTHQAPGARLQVAGNLGVLLRPAEAIGQTRQGSQLTYGVGVALRATPELAVAGELFGGVGLDEGGAANAPLQALAGLRYRVSPSMAVAIGGGFGILDGIGVPMARGFAMLSYSPSSLRPAIIGGEVVERDQLADPDNDGLATRDDRCPEQAEDRDLFDDGDGCPDLDNDGDGVLDGDDACPMGAEDRDGFADDDGCPDPDNDGDGLADGKDACPGQPEDMDKHDDLDGCPDLDDDADGIPDDSDACPLAAETINGNKDDDGCPDAGDGVVVRAGNQLELLEAVRFGKGATLARASLGVLGQVAATLRATPSITRLTVEVHVSARDDGDQALSEARAAAIVQWLTEWGIAADRLVASGKGSSAPLVPKTDKRAALLNERVYFYIGTP